MALGYLINRSGNQKALVYLKDSVKPEIWGQRKVHWNSPYHTNVDGRNIQLTKMAILGLALSGHPSAAETLQVLHAPGISEADKKFQHQVSGVISEALRAHEAISREGLMNYDTKRRSK